MYLICGFIGAGKTTFARKLEEKTGAVRITKDEWPCPVACFDLVASFTAWHWLDPQVRMAKAADALRVGGTLAVVATHHVAGGTDAFFIRAQECYEQWDPKTPPGLRLQPAASLPADSSEFAASGLFGRVENRRYEADITYTRAEYLDLLSTYSGHIRPSAQSCPPALVAGECHLFRRCQCRTPFVYSRGALASPCTG